MDRPAKPRTASGLATSDVDAYLRAIGAAGVAHGLIPDGLLPAEIARELVRLTLAAVAGDKRADQFLRTKVRIRPPVLPIPHSPVIRVGLVGPGLDHPGGAEDWMRTMVAEDVEGVVWSGIATINAPAPHWRVPSHVPTWFGRAGLVEIGARSDIAITWGSGPSHAALLRRSGCRVVCVSHSGSDASRAILADAPQWADGLCAVSESAARAYPPEVLARVEIVHNGVSPSRIAHTASRSEIRTNLGVRADERLAGYVGRLATEKNPLAVCRAVAALGPPWRAMVVGGGCDAEAMRQTIARDFHGAIVIPPVDSPGNVLAALDAFVLASPAEGFSLSLTEAWLASVPVVSTPVGAVPELEREVGALTFHVPIRHVDADLAMALEATNSRHASAIVARARSLAESRFTAQAMRERWSATLWRLWRTWADSVV